MNIGNRDPTQCTTTMMHLSDVTAQGRKARACEAPHGRLAKGLVALDVRGRWAELLTRHEVHRREQEAPQAAAAKPADGGGLSGVDAVVIRLRDFFRLIENLGE